MKGLQIVLDHLPDGQGGQVEVAALLEDGRLSDLLIDDADQPRPGTIYRGICDRPVKGQGGIFLRTPEGNGFLRQIKGMKPGEPLLVQVTGYAEPGKALPLTQRILFKSRYAIVTPGAPGINVSRSIKDEELRVQVLEIAHELFADHPLAQGDDPAGLILRSACATADPDDVAEDIAAMIALATQVLNDSGKEAEVLLEGPGPHELAWRDWSGAADVVDRKGAFADLGVDDLLERLARPEVGLGGDASMFVEVTRACVAVDVNTGADNGPASGLRANIAAAKDLPRQLRLRGLGGQIFLDLAPMGKKDRRQFETSLRAAFRQDATETVLAGWTPLGNYELQRKRARLPLAPILNALLG
ncbi:ribonuclease E/G [Pseudooceanicola spongiae]|uniref:Ribonuclease G n=1 Tax=Pseudooceanicola spongiae TaxID=2613965 RepID=A0A7L9WIL6_9RHOB|nr:ribonuclease E/G [Pseudooceanicola spongiae]QOL79547.1 ribonuclease G [Pseudooceanicola spongiae]